MVPTKLIALVLAMFLLGLSENFKAVQAADTCGTQLDKLVSCAASVVPGSTAAPTQQCCSALKAMPQDCSCQTINIINSLPAKCGISAIKCSSSSSSSKPSGAISAQATDTCETQLNKLVSCTPFVVPGSTVPPTAQCCSALKAMSHECSCNTINIINSLPAKCSLTPVKCASPKSSSWKLEAIGA